MLLPALLVVGCPLLEAGRWSLPQKGGSTGDEFQDRPEGRPAGHREQPGCRAAQASPWKLYFFSVQEQLAFGMGATFEICFGIMSETC